MLRQPAIALFVLALPLAAGCYDPERTTTSTSSSPAQQPNEPSSDECDADCQLCAGYCTVQLTCAAEPPTAEDCAWNCIGWLELASDACSDAYREVATCIGDLDCPGYDDPTTCVPELQAYHAECDDEAAAEDDDALPLMAR